MRAGAGQGPALVTGGAGFIGCNLAARLVEDGDPVIVLDSFNRAGAENNADWLRRRYGERILIIRGDVRDAELVGRLVKGAASVFHFAAQVAVTTSLIDPYEDFSVNVRGAITVLEALRNKTERTPLVFASTNKVYGDLSDIALTREADGYFPANPDIRKSGVSEARALSFHTPYGCSKGAADQYVLDYARSFDVPTAVMRMSCIFGPHQMGNEDQGWVAHFLIRALCGEPITIFGDGAQVRDVLYVDDAVDAYIAASRHIEKIKGRAFNLGGGPDNAISLNTLIALIAERTRRSPSVNYEPWRPGDQRYYVSDTARAMRELGLAPPLNWKRGVERLLEWLRSTLDVSAPEAHAEAAE